LVPFVGWYLLAPIAMVFGWTRSAFMRSCSWAMLLLAVLAAAGSTGRAAAPRVAWSVGWLAAATIGFRFAGGLRARRPAAGPPARAWRRLAASIPAARPGQDPDELIVLCERRIGRPVQAAARLRVKTPSGGRTHVLALAAGCLWWLELHPWRSRVGAILGYRPLEGLAAHTGQRRRGRHAIELSWPLTGELYVGTLRGRGAERLAGQLAADQFARTATSPRASEESR
jgi:hypothetical protein